MASRSWIDVKHELDDAKCSYQQHLQSCNNDATDGPHARMMLSYWLRKVAALEAELKTAKTEANA